MLMYRAVFRTPVVAACVAMAARLVAPGAAVADDSTPTHTRPAPLLLRVRLLDLDTYLDQGRRLVVLTDECQVLAPAETDVLLRPQADSDEPELAFPSGQACPVTFVGTDNAYLTSASSAGYRDVVSGQTLRTLDCPDLASVEPALVRLERVILMGDWPSVCHLAD
jgi:hypothetical protein